MRKSVTALTATPFLVLALASCRRGSRPPVHTTPETPTASIAASAIICDTLIAPVTVSCASIVFSQSIRAAARST